jgi:hypothetical protein
MLQSPVFVVGLNKSGTSLLYVFLAGHEELSGIRPFKPQKSGPTTATIVMQNYSVGEGQMIPDLIPKLRPSVGSGRWACPEFIDHYRLTEADLEPGDRDLVTAAYKSAMNRPEARLVEKSPPNLVRTRYLQALFPDAIFVALTRNPFANVAANAKKRTKWGTIAEQALHWTTAYRLFLEDCSHLRRVMIIRYEDFVADPSRVFADVCTFCGVSVATAGEISVQPSINDELIAKLSADDVTTISETVRPQLLSALGYGPLPARQL